jgi:hypothetical protein
VIRSPRDLRLALLALAVALPPLALGAPSPEPVVYHMLASVLAFGVWLACAFPQGSAGGADQRPPRGGPGPIAGLALGWLAAGLASAVLGVVQYVWPVIAGAAPLPEFIATPASSGRAVGNLRQPNQLTTLLALALCGLAWWGQSRAWPRAVLLPATALLVLGIVLTGSRMGWLMVGMLALWGAVDRGLRPQVRAMLLATVPLAVLFSIAAWAWGHLGGVTYFGVARMQSRSDISSSRFAIWSNTLALIREYPWTGVGVNTDAVPADQTRSKRQKIPFGACGLEHFVCVDAQFVEENRQFVHQRDVEVALGVFDYLSGPGRLH